jgi:lysozyme
MGATSSPTSPNGADREGLLWSDRDETAEPPLGIDVSHHNGVVDWTTVARSGVAFAFAKATEGERFRDHRFLANWPEMQAAGIVRGAYHFFRPAIDPEVQADNFCTTLDAAGGLGPDDLAPVVDVEETPLPNEWSGLPTPVERAARLQRWLDRVRTRLKRDPIVYTGRSFWNRVLGGWKPGGEVQLWIAQWTAAPPQLPTGGWSAWSFWQYSDSGAVAGVSGPVDVDRFNGDEAALRVAGGTNGAARPVVAPT